jgi:hypothetical protein
MGALLGGHGLGLGRQVSLCARGHCCAVTGQREQAEGGGY